MKYLIGIDPGVSGAVAIFTFEGTLLHVFDAPTVQMKVGKAVKRRISPELLVSLLQPYADASAWVEQVSARPCEGGAGRAADSDQYSDPKCLEEGDAAQCRQRCQPGQGSADVAAAVRELCQG